MHHGAFSGKHRLIFLARTFRAGIKPSNLFVNEPFGDEARGHVEFVEVVGVDLYLPLLPIILLLPARMPWYRTLLVKF